MLRCEWMILLFVVSVGSGCATIPTKQLDAFADSTKSLASNIQQTDGTIEQLTIHYVVNVANPDQPITTTTFQSISPFSDQSYDLSEDLHYRELVFKTVSDYAALLKSFGEGDSGSDIDKASTALAGSLKSVVTTADPADKNLPTYAGISATLIDLGGRALTSYIRQKALVKAMTRAQPDLLTISSAYSADLDGIGRYIDRMKDEFIARANGLRPRVRACRTGGRTTTDKECFRGRRDDETSRMKADADTATLLGQVTQVKDSLDSIRKATTNIPKAHQQILNILQGQPTDSEAIDQLVAAGQQANSFYHGLK
jgi:hypothetical protein